MKKQLILIAALTMSTMLYAQHGKRREPIADKMKTELSLNDSQYESIKAIDQKYKDKHIALRKDSTRSKEEKMQSFKTLRSEQQKEVNAMLTSDQRTKWEAHRKQEFEKGKVRMEKAGRKYEEKVKADLSLTNDQFTKFKKVNQDFRQKLSELHTSKLDETKRKETFRLAKSEYEQSMKSVLNADQYEKWEMMRADMKKRPHGYHRRG